VSGKSWIDSYKRRKQEKRERKRGKYSPGHRSFAAPTPEPKSPLCPLDLSDDLVTVSVPVFRTPVPLIERAIGSILRGSHQHVRVVAISDGDGRENWDDISEELRADPRLVMLCSPENWGPYFNHDIVLRASPGPFFAVQDSDDVSHYKRLELQLATLHETRAEAVHSPIYECDAKGRKRLSRCEHRAGEHWAHRADHFGLYNRATLLELGGYHAGFRLGYDTNLTSFLNLLAKTSVTSDALYTRHQRPESLTKDARTGYRSQSREAFKKELRSMWGAACTALRRSRRAAVGEIRSIALARVGSHGNPQLRDRLVEALREHLVGLRIAPPPLAAAQLRRLIAACHREKMEQLAAERLYRYCEKEQPSKITTLGTPLITAVALYSQRTGAEARCLEPDTAARTAARKTLGAIGLGATSIEQSPDVGTTPGILVLGERPSLAAIGRLIPGTQVWLPETRSAEQQAELPGRRLAVNSGMIQLVIEEP
jgi:hypothetical protein